MRRLPLFPLPVVLFPGAPMPLHVFEPRYRQMVAYCIEHDSQFGLLYHDPDRHGPFEVQPGQIGCVAEIVKMQPLPDGRSLIVCRGKDRFRVEDGIESGMKFHEALVEPFGDDPAGSVLGMVPRRRKSIALLMRVLDEVVRYRGPLPTIDAHQEAGFQIAQVIRIDPLWQQELLRSRGERERLDRLDELLHALLEAAAQEDGETGDDGADG